jgi:hypothetical protein
MACDVVRSLDGSKRKGRGTDESQRIMEDEKNLARDITHRGNAVAPECALLDDG